MKKLKEMYRKFLISIFPQSPSLQLLYPGLPLTPWNRKRSKEKLATWYGLRTTAQAYRDGIEEGFKRAEKTWQERQAA